MKYMVDGDVKPRDAEDVTVALQGGPGGIAHISFGFTDKEGGNVLITGGVGGTILFQEGMSIQEFVEAIVFRNAPDDQVQ